MPIQKPLLLDLPLPIRTSRLLIVPVDVRFAEQVHKAKEESQDIFIPWMPWAKDIGDLDGTKELLLRKQAKFLLREELMFLVFTQEDEFVIAAGIQHIDWDVPMAEIGYWCKKSAHGKGYVTETSNALIRYAFDVLKMRKMCIGMDSENKASEAVPLRLNMAKEFEAAGMVKTLHPPEDGLRIRKSYACFGVDDLPPLEVSW